MRAERTVRGFVDLTDASSRRLPALYVAADPELEVDLPSGACRRRQHGK
jgi:hypothetical protein